jgi:D-sedoheptulose 7-phosphate isomerase
MKFESEIKLKINDSINCKKKLIDHFIPVINQVALIMIEAARNSKCIYWFGNGGSATDAQHLACELVNRFYFNRKALPSLAFTENVANLTSIANDFSFDDIFSRQAEAYVKPGDIAVGLSTSGNSLNVLNGLKTAKKLQAVTIALTGETGGKLKNEADYLIAVPATDTPVIQECHIMIGHILCYLIEKEIFKKQD